DPGRDEREHVAAPASVEQYDEDRARQDNLRDLEIRVDVDDRGELDSEVDRVGCVRCQRPATVVHELNRDVVVSVDQVGEGDGSEGHHGHVVDSVQEDGDVPLVRDGRPTPRGHEREIGDVERHRDVAAQDKYWGGIRDRGVGDVMRGL